MLCSCLTVFLLQDRKCVKRWTLDFHGDQTLTVSDHKAIKHWPTLTTCYLPRLCSCLFLSLKPADTENICQKKHLPQRTSWSIYLFWMKHLKHFKTFLSDRHEFYRMKPTHINRSELIKETTSSLSSLISLWLPYLDKKMFSVPVLPAVESDFLFLHVCTHLSVSPEETCERWSDEEKRRRWRRWGFSSLHKMIFNVEQQNKRCRGFAAINVYLSIGVITTTAYLSF